MAKVYESPIIEIEPDENHGNTKLPYGIAKGYGLDTTGKTPREVWDMLKGYGVTPENEYKKLKERAEEKIEDKPEVVDVNKEVRKKQIETIRGHIDTKLKRFSDNTKTQLKSTLEKLDDNEVAFIEKTMPNKQISKGGGLCWGEYSIQIPDGTGHPIDKALGYNSNMTTFYHEYGHSAAVTIGKQMEQDGKATFSRLSIGAVGRDFNGSKEMQAVLKEDYIDLMNKCGKKAGLTKPFNPDRISREYTQAFYSMLREESQKEISEITKPSEIPERYATFEAYDNWVSKWAYSYSSKTEQQRREEWQKEYDQKKQEYDSKLAKYEKYKDQIENAKVKNEQAGILSDFIGGATNGRIAPYKNGYWGHKQSYFKGSTSYGVSIGGMDNGVEPWAEYFSAKMTRDTGTIELMKKWLPKTYAKYEEIYKEYVK